MIDYRGGLIPSLLINLQSISTLISESESKENIKTKVKSAPNVLINPRF